LLLELNYSQPVFAAGEEAAAPVYNIAPAMLNAGVFSDHVKCKLKQDYSPGVSAFFRDGHETLVFNGFQK